MDYVTLVDQVAKTKDWALVTSLKELGYDERVILIGKVFLGAVEAGDDEIACRYFGFLMGAISDAVLHPFFEQKNQKRPPELAYSDESRAGLEMVKALRARKAIEFHAQLPRSRKTMISVQITENERAWEPADEAVLLKTKAVMLTEIAERWRDTKDEEEADRLFDYLVEYSAMFQNEAKLVPDTMRKVMDKSFPRPRLCRHLMRLGPKRNPFFSKRDIEQVLSSGFARLTEFPTMVQIVQATGDFGEKKPEALTLLGKISEQVLTLEQRVGKFVAVLHKNFYDQVQIEYAAIDHAVIRLTMQNFEKGEAAFQDRFAAYRSSITDWRKANPDVKITLCLLAVPWPGPRAIFSHEEQLF